MKHAPHAPVTPPTPSLAEHLDAYARDTTHALVLARIEGGIIALDVARQRAEQDVLFGAEHHDVVEFLAQMSAELADAARRGPAS